MEVCYYIKKKKQRGGEKKKGAEMECPRGRCQIKRGIFSNGYRNLQKEKTLRGSQVRHVIILKKKCRS